MPKLAIEGGTPAVPSRTHGEWPLFTTGLASAPEELRSDLARYLGLSPEQCLPVLSGTAALHAALVAADVQPGDEVITSAYGSNATAHAIHMAGAIPVFVDIDPETATLDPAQIGPATTTRTTAVVPVDALGMPADMRAIAAVTDELAVISNAAQSVGAVRDGEIIRSGADATVFDLSDSPVLPGGRSGLYITRDPHAMKSARRFANLGEDARPLAPGQTAAHWSWGHGCEYAIREHDAQFACAQLARLPGFLDRARWNAELLSDGLADLPGIQPPTHPKTLRPNWWKYIIRVVPEQVGWSGDTRELRNRILYALRREGVAAGLWQEHAVPQQAAFRRGGPTPWLPVVDDDKLPDWHAERYPETLALLQSGIVIGSTAFPLHAQKPRVVELYVEALRKVMDNFAVVATCEYYPLEVVPAIPRDLF